MQTSDNGIAKIKQWEGFRAKAYRDGGGFVGLRSDHQCGASGRGQQQRHSG